MPYIKPERRAYLDKAINDIVDGLRQLESDFGDQNNFEGNVNYVFSSIIARSYDISYRSINDVQGVLKCVGDEYKRCIVDPYEAQREYDNGSVYNQPTAETLLKQLQK